MHTNIQEQILSELKVEKDSETQRLGTTTLQHHQRPSRQKHQRHLQNISANSCKKKHILISTWNILYGRPHIRPQKSFSKFLKTEIIPCVFSHCKGIKLEINNEKDNRTPTNAWKLNNRLLNDQWVTEEIQKETKTFLNSMKMKIHHFQNLKNTVKVVSKGKFIAFNTYKNTASNDTSWGLRKTTTDKTQK